MKTIVYKRVTQLFVVLFLLVTGTEVKAQYPYDFSFGGIPYDSKTIVRSYDDQRVVVYYEDGGRGYVSLVNVITNNARTVPLDDGISMNDMYITDDSVFLCGNYNLWDYNLIKVDCMNSNIGSYNYDKYPISPVRWQTVVEPVEMGIPSICIEN